MRQIVKVFWFRRACNSLLAILWGQSCTLNKTVWGGISFSCPHCTSLQPYCMGRNFILMPTLYIIATLLYGAEFHTHTHTSFALRLAARHAQWAVCVNLSSPLCQCSPVGCLCQPLLPTALCQCCPVGCLCQPLLPTALCQCVSVAQWAVCVNLSSPLHCVSVSVLPSGLSVSTSPPHCTVSVLPSGLSVNLSSPLYCVSVSVLPSGLSVSTSPPHCTVPELQSQ